MTTPKDRAFVLSVLTREEIPHADVIAQLAAPSLRITTVATRPESLPMGASRFGGAPDVPVRFTWPERNDRPLTFLAQIDLSEVHAPELPSSGWLLFFYDLLELPWGYRPEHAGGAVVQLIQVERTELHRTVHPTIDGGPSPAKLHALTFTAVIDVPDSDDSLLYSAGVNLAEEEADEPDDAADADAVGSDDDDDYLSPIDLRLETYHALIGELAGVEDGEPYHHLLGHPQLPQGDMRIKCEQVSKGIGGLEGDEWRAAYERGLTEGIPEAWQLLLQLSSDDALGWNWVDRGRIFFWIRKDDLAARAFGRAWLILQT